MKKIMIFVLVTLISLMCSNVFACHYENIKVGTDGVIRGKLVPCNDTNCPTFNKLINQKEEVVYERDIAKEK